LKRLLEHKLSYSLRYGDRVISSGWSQGLIDDFSQVKKQAEDIAQVLNSRWALNIQGRVDSQGIFYPFEINPRHSGTTYLRALAGFNEPHILIQQCLRGYSVPLQPLRKGYYLRSFTEKYVALAGTKTHD
jgi:carbamoyl-phosphate synthase large subunit